MSAILLEAPDSRQLRESTAELLAAEHTKASHPQGAPSTTEFCGEKHETVDEERKRGGGNRKGRAWVSQEELAAAANVVGATVYQFRVKLVVHKKYASCSNTVAPT